MDKWAYAHAALTFLLVIFGRTVESSYKDNSTCPSIYSCANCTAVRLCYPTGTGLIEYKTLNCSSKAPFCDPTTGTCSAISTIKCSTTGEMVCLKDGTFPHPTDCSKFFTCSNLESYSFDCLQSYYYYDSSTEKCIYNRGCYRFNCNYNNGYKAPYPNDPSIYSYCINGIATLVDRCYGKDELNVTSQQCEPTCRYEGLIPDTSNCSRYYRCNATPVKGQYVMTLHSCPSGQAFSEYEFQCQPINQVASCPYNYTSAALLSSTALSQPSIHVTVE